MSIENDKVEDNAPSNGLPTWQENNLAMIDERIEAFRQAALRDSGSDGYNENLATMYALMEYRKAMVAPPRYSSPVGSYPAPSGNGIGFGLIVVLPIIAMIFGLILGVVLF